MEEENENRFMNQCNVYKKEIKEHKKHIDSLEMNFDSIRKLFEKIMDIWVEEGENVDDFKDNLKLFATVARLTEKEKAKLTLYVQRYVQIRGFLQE